MAGLAALAVLGLAVPAQAQSDSATAAAPLPTPAPPTTQGGNIPDQQATLPETDATESAKWKELNKLVLKGWVTAVPTFDDTVDQDVGGWRSALAQAGFGATFYSINLGAYDFAQAGKNIGGTQLYNGQKPTYQSGNQTLVLTYDLGHLGIGLDGGQWAVIVAGTTNGYQSRDGLDGVRIKGFSWYQPILHGKAELELGIIANQTDYMGTSVGGSLSGGALGPQAGLPVEAGMSYGNYGAPTFSARINWTKHFYTRSAVQRSISPQGSTVEEDSNPTGFNLGSPGARALFIQEIGYRINATEGTKSFWVRGGGLYNTSDYVGLLDKALHHNYFVYGAVDRQLTQPDAGHPARGLYVGVTYNAAPGNVDLIDRYYEARVYMKGPFDSRPNDMVSLVAAINAYGADGRAENTLEGFAPYGTTQTYTGSYSFRITHGLYIQPGIGVVVHPVYNRNIGTAVNGLLNLVTFL